MGFVATLKNETSVRKVKLGAEDRDLASIIQVQTTKRLKRVRSPAKTPHLNLGRKTVTPKKIIFSAQYQ